jgi:hypothetical protein
MNHIRIVTRPLLLLAQGFDQRADDPEVHRSSCLDDNADLEVVSFAVWRFNVEDLPLFCSTASVTISSQQRSMTIAFTPILVTASYCSFDRTGAMIFSFWITEPWLRRRSATTEPPLQRELTMVGPDYPWDWYRRTYTPRHLLQELLHSL